MLSMALVDLPTFKLPTVVLDTLLHQVALLLLVMLIVIGALTMTTPTSIWIGTHLPEFVLDKLTMATAT